MRRKGCSIGLAVPVLIELNGWTVSDKQLVKSSDTRHTETTQGEDRERERGPQLRHGRPC